MFGWRFSFVKVAQGFWRIDADDRIFEIDQQKRVPYPPPCVGMREGATKSSKLPKQQKAMKGESMNKELEKSRQVVAVLTIEDIENYLWEEHIQQLNKLLKAIEDGRESDRKRLSRLLIFD